jgi:hypothetical protein
MTACTPKEELEWRSRLAKPRELESRDTTDLSLFSSLTLDIKSLGTIFGKPGSMAQRLSIHRATTVSPKSPLCQVILRNTSAVKDVSGATLGSSINRSQSLLTTNIRIPVLAPSRGDRARLEALLSDVWSREVLPFPGMTARARSEQLVRNSASSMIRKLSVASIAGSLGNKRSASHTSLPKDTGDDGPSTEPSDEGERLADSSHLYAGSPPSDTSLPAKALHTSSPNSARLSRQTSAVSKTSTSRTTDKENVGCAPTNEPKPVSKWGKVSVLHRGIVPQGLKSLFR